MFRLCRDLLASIGVWTIIAYFGHPTLAGGAASVAVMVAVAARLPGPYSPGDAGSLGPHDGPIVGQGKVKLPYWSDGDRLE